MLQIWSFNLYVCTEWTENEWMNVRLQFSLHTLMERLPVWPAVTPHWTFVWDKHQEVNCKLFMSRSTEEEQQLSLEPERQMGSFSLFHPESSTDINKYKQSKERNMTFMKPVNRWQRNCRLTSWWSFKSNKLAPQLASLRAPRPHYTTNIFKCGNSEQV